MLFRSRVIEVKDFGATLDLLEYPDQKAFVHISEVASGWVKYIRDFIREGQMVVAKVTKVKKGSKIIDASVRQVSGHRKKEKIRQVVREEIYIQLVNNWPKSSGPVKGLTVPKQDYKKQVPQ